ncbi:MAG: protocatechuate 3,4-dioxygenase subunit alpha [Actinobacteria bacterium]|nr:protocatechuate 3,4-dioxygenase subunit alpha [Actinomycetota bacterium]
MTPSQTAGPFLSLGLRWPDGPHAVLPGTRGAVWLRGRVLDAAGEPVTDALVETWQADGSGRFADREETGGFRGFGRSETVDGEYAVLTVKPAPLIDPLGRTHAPHVALSVFARGLLDRVVTRLYFADEVAANSDDPLLTSLPDDAARRTLLAEPSADGYRLDLVLQGSDETVFFAL